jgi:ParB-like chromosome segregation protein Spo0J
VTAARLVIDACWKWLANGTLAVCEPTPLTDPAQVCEHESTQARDAVRYNGGAEATAVAAAASTGPGEPKTVRTNTLLPPLTPEEYEALKADIEINGILVPIIRTEDGVTIDGHHREQIAAELGITDIPVRVVTGLSDEERRHLAISLNAQRRQLTGEQKRHLIREELKRSADLSNNWLAELLGVDDKTVQAVRVEEEAAGNIEPVTLFRCKDGKKRKYRRTAPQQKLAAEIKQQEVPLVLASSTTSDEPQQAVPTEPPAEPIILPVQTSESAPATMPLNTAPRSSFEVYLAGRMAAHRITGTVSDLLALLTELGVDPKKFQAA